MYYCNRCIFAVLKIQCHIRCMLCLAFSWCVFGWKTRFAFFPSLTLFFSLAQSFSPPPQHPRIVCECAKSTGIIAMHQQQTCYANQLKANKQSNDDITCLLSRYPHSNINSWTIRYAKHGRKYANISTRTIHTHTHILLKHMTISESHTHSLFTPYDRTMWYSVGINVLVEEDWINWLQMWASERLEPVRLKLFARVPLLTSDVPTENSSHFHCWLFTVKSNPLPSPPRHTHTHTHQFVH